MQSHEAMKLNVDTWTPSQLAEDRPRDHRKGECIEM